MAERPLRLLLRIGFSTLLLAGIAWGTRVPVGGEPEEGLVRLAWRTMGEVVEVCRDVPEEEQARRPPHMRRDRICDQTSLPYRLRVELDGQVALERLVRPAGLFGDRPLAVLEDLPAAPGRRQLEITYEPATDALLRDLPAAEVAAALAEAPRFRLTDSVALRPGRILVVRLEGGRLVIPEAAR